MSPPRQRVVVVAAAIISVAACQSSESAAPAPLPSTTRVQRVHVTVDGSVVFGASVTQGGGDRSYTTDQRGNVDIPIDESIHGAPWIVASFPSTRARAVQADPKALLDIDLKAYAPNDDPTYVFEQPGRTSRPTTASECAHCHAPIAKGFERSAHVGAASNPKVHDLYAGTAAAWADADSCAMAGGTMRMGRAPGDDAMELRCYVGASALQQANPSCATPPCDVGATSFAGCADCHAPGIDGKLGGRDLLEARGPAFDSGVFCDVCHKVEGIRDLAPPGVAGRLHVVRPSEPGPGPTGRLPLTFGPFGDVGLVRMGSVGRGIFKTGELCTGCHEQAVTVAPSPRAPDGKLAVDSTSTEWSQGPMAGMPCQSCHGAKLNDEANAAGLAHHDGNPDVATGWPRPPGSVHDHAFCGPRGERNIAALALGVELSTKLADGKLEIAATVTNRGAGHALPSGEAMRAMFLLVDASCAGSPLVATGGDVVADIGGSAATKVAGEDWMVWPGAAVGDELRVVSRSGAWRDYDGPGVFAKGMLAASDKGLPEETRSGVRTITSVAPDGTVTLDAALPPGDVVVRVSSPSSQLAAAPGFAFARVLTSASGQRQVPHFLARDVAFDDRLPPGRAMTTHHTFAASCATPTVRARLVHRLYPLWLATERGWPVGDRVIVEVSK